MTTAPVFLTLAEVAARWKVGKKVVRAMVDRGELRVKRFSRKTVRVSLAEIERAERPSSGARSRDAASEGVKDGRLP